jgi:FKBP-type peptidyl-prolyl cis-trans isomerase 2
VKNSHIILAVILILGAILMPGCNAGRDAAQAKNGNTVQVHYTGKLADGTVFDSSVGREPFEFTLGAGQVIPGFEKAALGMKVGEKKTVTIPADEAYGPHRDEQVVELPREELPSGMTPEVGQQLVVTQQDGRQIIVVITEVSDETVTIDANHPLAGKDLTFEIELVKIQ